MQMPVISRPHEPALFARTPGLERHRVAPGGLTVIALEPDDRLEVIDVEGDQRAELLAFAEDGREQAILTAGRDELGLQKEYRWERPQNGRG